MQYFKQKEFDKVCPTPEELRHNTEALVEWVLDPTRAAMGTPIYITCGYRSQAYDRAKGRTGKSQHCKAEAADFQCKDMATAVEYIVNNTPFDQLIWEHGNSQQPQWVHVSHRRNGNNRGQLLYYDGQRYTTPEWLTAKKKSIHE